MWMQTIKVQRNFDWETIQLLMFRKIVKNWTSFWLYFTNPPQTWTDFNLVFNLAIFVQNTWLTLIFSLRWSIVQGLPIFFLPSHGLNWYGWVQIASGKHVGLDIASDVELIDMNCMYMQHRCHPVAYKLRTICTGSGAKSGFLGE